MTASKLTAATVPTLSYKHSPAGWCAYWHPKLKGFGLRITSKGARSYIVKFRLRGGGKICFPEAGSSTVG